MKAKLLSFALLSSLLLSAPAQDSVYSNVVGMVKMTAFRGKYTQVASNFVFDNGPVTVSEFFGTSLPPFSSVYFWSTEGAGEYLTATYGTRGWSNPDIEIDRAKGFIVSIPETAPEESYDIIFNGSVPSQTEEASLDVTLIPGFTMIGMPYAVPVSLVDADFSPEFFDQVLYWDGTTWQISTFGSRGGWSENFEIQPGQAFFYKSVSLTERTWTFDNPINLN